MWPKLSNINETIFQKIVATPSLEYSKYNCFARIISGVGVSYAKLDKETKTKIVQPGKGGLIMVSNPDWSLFQAAGQTGPSFYGTPDRSGTIGVDWFGNAVNTSESTELDVPFKPSPVVTAINSKEGKDQISRHCDVKITAYTLAQVELIQKYLMEPGYSLLIEWGWNTPEGVSGLVPLSPTTNIVSLIGERNLNNDSLHSHRIKTNGDYDSFFGFIVGGTVDTNGDAFDISIKLRGAPGLPTYLQGHANVSKLQDNKITNDDAHPPFGVTSLNLTDVSQQAERRFKQMFNLLPKTRQTNQVVNLPFTPGQGWGSLDFINFDPIIDAEISTFTDAREKTAEEEENPEEVEPVTENQNSGQQNLTESQQGTDKERKDEAYLKWKRLNVITYEIAKAIDLTPLERDSEGNYDPGFFQKNYSPSALADSEYWASYKASLGLAAPKTEELTEILQTRFELWRGSWYYLKPEVDWPPVPPAPEPEVTEPAAGTTGNVTENTQGFTIGTVQFTATEVKLAGGLPIPKEKFFSKNRYLRFGRAIQILNANSELSQYLIAGKPINTIVDIKDAYIGAFEGIYSTKPESLLIPGRMPDFSKFFMQQNLVELSEKSAFIDNSIPTGNPDIPYIEFAQRNDLDSNGLKEEKYKWGKLEWLYINFDLFKKELEKPNRTMREVLESLLNEMSLAVNSFWNFQIVEKTNTIKVGGKDIKTTVYTVVDENWIGKNISSPVQFIHSGDRSRFLSAELTMDVGGSLTQQIIAKRLNLATNPDQPQVALGGVFTEQRDIFLPKYVGPEYKAGGAGTSGTSGTSGTAGATKGKFDDRFSVLNQSALTEDQKAQQAELNQRAASLENDLKNFDTNNASRKADLDAKIARKELLEDEIGTIILQNAANNVFEGLGIDAAAAARVANEQRKKQYEAELATLEPELTKLKTDLDKEKQALIDAEKQLEIDVEKYLEGAKQQVATNVSNNLDIIDIVPNPTENSITQDDLQKFLTDITLFDQKFKIYCCKDQKFFNVLKMNNLQVSTTTGTRLSHPLPIKYSFTILGKSGIRRGDTFTIKGIPEKYSKHGFFQVTEVEHTIQDMKWVTRVQGEFRQIQ